MENIFTKTFTCNIEKLDEALNLYIENEKLNHFNILIPYYQDTIHKCEVRDYLDVTVIVYFKSHYANNDEIKEIKELKENLAKIDDIGHTISLRKSECSDDIIFYFLGEYYDINDVFNIKLNIDHKSVGVFSKDINTYDFDFRSERKSKFYDQYFNMIKKDYQDMSEFIKKRYYDLDEFISNNIENKLQEIYFGKDGIYAKKEK